MAYRYSNRKVYRNLISSRKELIARAESGRPFDHLDPWQFASPMMNFPSAEDIDNLNVETYVWQYGDKFWKIANEFYGNPDAWWVIAWFNKKPLEADWRPGDIVNVPMNLEEVYKYID